MKRSANYSGRLNNDSKKRMKERAARSPRRRARAQAKNHIGPQK